MHALTMKENKLAKSINKQQPKSFSLSFFFCEDVKSPKLTGCSEKYWVFLIFVLKSVHLVFKRPMRTFRSKGMKDAIISRINTQ
jgi:hypothetical protein